MSHTIIESGISPTDSARLCARRKAPIHAFIHPPNPIQFHPFLHLVRHGQSHRKLPIPAGVLPAHQKAPLPASIPEIPGPRGRFCFINLPSSIRLSIPFSAAFSTQSDTLWLAPASGRKALRKHRFFSFFVLLNFVYALIYWNPPSPRDLPSLFPYRLRSRII